MLTDYLDAHLRHLEDAKLLLQAQRYANADQLFGLSAECGLKRLMQAFGMPMGQKGPTNTKDRVHVDAIGQRYETYRRGVHFGSRYALPSANPFAHWSVHQRYAHRSYATRSVVNAHEVGAQDVANLVKTAQTWGHL